MSDAKKSEALSALVDALDSTFWSSWQGTASFSDELEQARQILKRDLLNKYAPDLLEVLETLLSLHDARVDTADAWNESMEEARVVIDKATGESK